MMLASELLKVLDAAALDKSRCVLRLQHTKQAALLKVLKQIMNDPVRRGLLLWQWGTKHALFRKRERSLTAETQHCQQFTSIRWLTSALLRCRKGEVASRLHCWRVSMQLETWTRDAMEMVHHEQRLTRRAEREKEGLFIAMQNTSRSSTYRDHIVCHRVVDRLRVCMI